MSATTSRKAVAAGSRDARSLPELLDALRDRRMRVNGDLTLDEVSAELKRIETGHKVYQRHTPRHTGAQELARVHHLCAQRGGACLSDAATRSAACHWCKRDATCADG
jgi:hypothetical protein